MKRLLLILFIPLLALVLIGCDPDMRSGVAGFLGAFGGNAYVGSGLVPANTSNADNAKNHIAGLGTVPAEIIDGVISEVFGIDFTLDTEISADTFLAPQSKEEQAALKDELADTLNSPTQTDQFKKDMAGEASPKQIEAAQGTAEILNAILDTIIGDGDGLDFLENLKLPKIDDETDLTQGDILILQLMTDMVANTINTLTDIVGDDFSELSEGAIQENIDDILAIIDDALFAAQIADELGGSSSIDFTGGLDLATLLDQMGGDRSNRSLARAGDDDFDFEEMLPALFGLSKDITKTMGAKISGDEVKIDKGTYQSFLLMMSAYRSSLEYAFGIVDSDDLDTTILENEEHIDISTIFKYVLSVFVTEHDRYIKSLDDETKSSRSLIEDFLSANPNFVTGQKMGDDEEPVMPDGFEEIYKDFGDYINNKDLDGNLSKTIQNALLGINKFAGITQLDDLLKDEFDLKSFFED